MFSVIIATMWKGRRADVNRNLLPWEIQSNEDVEFPLQKMLCELDNHSLVNDIILIDNNSSQRPDWFNQTNWKNVKVVDYGKNIYVNPAWNEGIRLSKNDKLCIMSDDVWYDCKLLNLLIDDVTPELGCIGLDLSCYQYDGEWEKLLKNVNSTKETDSWLLGYGCLMFLHKNNFLTIPNDILIWYGDYWIVKHHFESNKIPRKLFGVKVHTNSASTSSLAEFDQTKQNDTVHFNALMGQDWNDFYIKSVMRLGLSC